ncbi:type II toxin-antitoxin system RelE/ParE family toxin [Desulfobacula sp.]|uniref:type II toxin-antitoxin system RelE/ParE family toxin n=1 Tax=Desulfobacula sp. TaxID=2593537 RepID=UPI0025B8CAAE|nr:type II toxin-antitoxin system RelE/ParE family toxin [Desulfobacula sp.]MBC2705132.1 type II toxin-antitoxin system RelE/ParE family toxin [Desulfobacula sp.]
MKEINFYRAESGKSPVEEFLDNLTAKQAKKVAWVLNLVEEHINVPSKYLKKMVNTDNLWEVRVNFGSNIFRILCFFDGSEIIILTHAFQKKTQKTPRQAIKIAEKRMKDYFKRKKL